ncbi:cation transporter [Marilutibacter aestuarii]|uniref:Cation diffusion facilitator family transporter n=1 Tax=Marilutibacter aestuarii TaxID=1706195 RepID=A0A507ZZQ9_9GAMM|nr:cation transporter [Lysobacter aestuarii]TQD43029.1 cation diffusion facilitator family transporter [Lysobacter aestuarii]
MSMRPHHPLPPRQAALLRRAERLSAVTLVALACTAVLMYLAMGESQAMKTAWAEDLLSMVPPLGFLLAARFSRKPPDATYVNGRARAFDIAFLAAAVALSGVGIWLVVDNMIALVTREHPAIGSVQLFGHHVWLGWVMIAALLASAIPPVILGRLKMQLARELHLKPLHTDADMNKADWMTALAGVAGIIGIGFGWWWADAVAALVIAADVLHDGVRNMLHAIRDLHDARPETVERGQADPVVERIRTRVMALDWVEDCEVRLHEEGMRLCGVLVVAPRDQRSLAARLAEARATAREAHWRIDDLVATFAQALPSEAPAPDAPA